VDRSALSVLTRAWERTDTLVGDLDALAREFPTSVSCTLSDVPDHRKLLCVTRADPAQCTAIFGGINIGGARALAGLRARCACAS
jgi:hypothetical protein